MLHLKFYKQTGLIRLLLCYLMAILLFLPGLLPAKERITSSKAEVFQISSNHSPKIDGRLTEPFWEQASPIGPLTMVEPNEGVPSSEQTEIRMAVTREAICFGIMCYDQHPGKVVSYTMQRDAQLSGEDHVKIVLDTFLNGRTGYIFAVNPNGARYDALIEKGGGGENSQWDGIWEAAARRSKDGWSVEIYLPVKTLRFGIGLRRWGFNVERRIQRLLETDRWASPNRNFKVTNVSQAGQLVSLPIFQQGRGLTIRPFTLGSRTQNNPEEIVSRYFEPGLDVLKNFGGNITGLLSINTDFAETEVDTRRINLTRFPLFFPEKRTFFLEGSDIYEFGLGMGSAHNRDLVPFFSRRVGLTEGQAIPLDVAIKATGSVGRFSFGVFDALIRPSEGLTPRTNLFAARGFQSIWAESKVGFLVAGGDPLGRSNSWEAGIDFIYKTSRFKGNENFLMGGWILMNNRKDLGNDNTAWGFKIDYPNDLWDVSLIFKRIGVDFDPSMGFVPWKGIYKMNFDVMYKPRPEWPWLRQMIHQFFTQSVYDQNGEVLQWRIFTAPINWRLESGDRVEFNIVPQMERLPEFFLITQNVDISAGKYNWWRYRLEFQTASKRRVTTKFTWWFGTFYNGKIDQIQAEISWRPSHRLNLALEGERDIGSLPSGDVDIQLARARINLFLSPNLQILSFLQYDNLTKSLGMNARLRYTYRSLLDIFIVYNRSWLEIHSTFGPQLNQLFIKVQYAWRT